MDWTENLRRAFASSLQHTWTKAAELMPNLAGMLLILIIGYLVSRLLKWITVLVLRNIHFDLACEKTGLSDMVRSVGLDVAPAAIVGRFFFWILMLMFLVSAIDVLGMESLSHSISLLVDYIPSVIGALVIVVFGLMLANFIRHMVHGAAERLGLDYASAIGRFVYGIFLIVISSLAIGQLQIETQLVNRVIEIIFMATGAALAIALGFGTQDMAKNVVAGVYARESFALGSKLVLGQDEGIIESVQAVNTRIRHQDGTVYVIPNGQLMDTTVKQRPT